MSLMNLMNKNSSETIKTLSNKSNFNNKNIKIIFIPLYLTMKYPLKNYFEFLHASNLFCTLDREVRSYWQNNITFNIKSVKCFK